MYKELSIILIVIAIIVGLDILTNNYTSNATVSLSKDLEELKAYVIREEENEINPKIKEIEERWNQYHNVLAYYIEHDELEKVETELTTMKGSAEVKEYKHCVGNLEAAIFILEHIQDKERFSIQSIF